MRTPHLAIASILLAACPSTDPTPPSIDEVIVETPIALPSFVLRIKGHGFGLRNVTFDLSAGEGVAKETGPRVVVLSAAGTVPAEIGDIAATITSPTEARAAVGLREPLPRGVYGIELYVGDAAEPLAVLKSAFSVGDTTASGDTGVVTTPRDAGLTGADAAPSSDAPTSADADDPTADGGSLDPPDVGGFFDAAQPAYSGLGPFPANVAYRRAITLANDTGLASPLDVTVRILVPHAQMLQATPPQSRADGRDLAVYNGLVQLPHQIEDVALLGTSAGLPLALGSDPAAVAPAPPSDAIYVFAERFANAFNSNANDPNAYNDRWETRCPDRVTAALNGSKCRSDAENGPTRRTFATPRVQGMITGRGPNELYEVVAYIAGAMQTQADLLYFSYGPDNSSFDQTTLLPELAYDPGFRPNASITFTEINNRNRTVTGWRLPPTGQPYTRMRASFVPNVNTPNLHFRFISTDNQTNANTQMQLDDLVVRRALNPDFRVTLGPVEVR
jgi:hypothetical protein